MTLALTIVQGENETLEQFSARVKRIGKEYGCQVIVSIRQDSKLFDHIDYDYEYSDRLT